MLNFGQFGQIDFGQLAEVEIGRSRSFFFFFFFFLFFFSFYFFSVSSSEPQTLNPKPAGPPPPDRPSAGPPKISLFLSFSGGLLVVLVVFLKATKIQRMDPPREGRKKNVAGEGKKARNFALSPPPFRGPTLHSGPPPFGASTLRGLHPSGPPPFGAHPCGPKIQHSKIGRSRNWPKSKLAEVDRAPVEGVRRRVVQTNNHTTNCNNNNQQHTTPHNNTQQNKQKTNNTEH